MVQSLQSVYVSHPEQVNVGEIGAEIRDRPPEACPG